MRYLIFLAIIGAALAVPKNGQRIVGGSDTTIDKHPYMAYMQYGGMGDAWVHSCSGSLISTRKIVSAAHCYERDSISRWRVVLGSSTTSSGGSAYLITRIAIHPEYSGSLTVENDIAIITLIRYVPLSENVRPISIAGQDAYELPDDTVLTAIGWGTSSSGNANVQLQSVEVNLINQEICAARYADLKAQPGFENVTQVTDGMICAGILDVGGKDAYQGDSGGPLVHFNGQDQVLVGVISWAEPSYPGVYTRISRYSDWIIGV